MLLDINVFSIKDSFWDKAEKMVADINSNTSCTVNFMTQKMIVEFEEGVDEKKTMKQVLKNCKKVEDDCEIDF